MATKPKNTHEGQKSKAKKEKSLDLTITSLGVWGRGVQLNLPLWFFQNYIFQRKGEALLFVTFYIIISHIFPENFIEIPELVQKI